MAAVGADLIQSQILAQTMTAAVKMSVQRTRPDGTQYSFPSGHSSVTFATATVLQRDLGWKVGVPAYGLATYVAASRIQDKRHFLSDVAFGAAIGIVAGRSVTVGQGDGRFAVAPAAAPGGGGISFTWLGSTSKFAGLRNQGPGWSGLRALLTDPHTLIDTPGIKQFVPYLRNDDQLLVDREGKRSRLLGNTPPAAAHSL